MNKQNHTVLLECFLQALEIVRNKNPYTSVLTEDDKRTFIESHQKIIAEFLPVWVRLSNLEQAVVARIYDLSDRRYMQAEIDSLIQQYGISRRTVYRIRAKALNKIKTLLKKRATDKN